MWEDVLLWDVSFVTGINTNVFISVMSEQQQKSRTSQKTALRLQTSYVVPSYFNIYNYCYLYTDTVLPVPQKDKPAAVHAECGGEDALEAPVCLAVLPACGCHQAVLGCEFSKTYSLFLSSC